MISMFIYKARIRTPISLFDPAKYYPEVDYPELLEHRP